MSHRTRQSVVFAALATALLCGRLAAQEKEPDWSKVQIKASKVSGNIYMLEGQGGNIAASVGEDGIVIVDDQFAPLAEKIQASLKSLGITDKPVRFVINTHYHGDHSGGNAPFANSGSTVIAQDNVRKRLESGAIRGMFGHPPLAPETGLTGIAQPVQTEDGPDEAAFAQLLAQHAQHVGGAPVVFDLRIPPDRPGPRGIEAVGNRRPKRHRDVDRVTIVRANRQTPPSSIGTPRA